MPTIQKQHPRIVTASWFSPLAANYCRVGISRGTPRGQEGYKMYRKLQPGPYLKLPDREFTKRYCREVLAPLDAAAIVAELVALAAGQVPALLCFEHAHSAAWCHRALVSAWLACRLGIEVHEVGREAEGHGLHHPKFCGTAAAVMAEWLK